MAEYYSLQSATIERVEPEVFTVTLDEHDKLKNNEDLEDLLNTKVPAGKRMHFHVTIAVMRIEDIS